MRPTIRFQRKDHGWNWTVRFPVSDPKVADDKIGKFFRRFAMKLPLGREAYDYFGFLKEDGVPGVVGVFMRFSTLPDAVDFAQRNA